MFDLMVPITVEYVGNTFVNIRLISLLILRNLKLFLKCSLLTLHLRDSLLRGLDDGVRGVVVNELGQSLVESRHLVVVIVLNY